MNTIKQQPKQQQRKVRSKRRNIRRRRNSGGNTQQRQAQVQLSQCARTYAVAQLDPFQANLSGMQPCIPDLGATPSMKFSTLNRGTFQIGQNAVGFVLVAPNTAANDVPVVAVTNPGYTSDFNDDITGPGTPGVDGVNDNRYPWDSADNTYARLVGCGLRIRYVGTELNRGGTIISRSLVDDNLASLIGRNPQDIMSDPSSNTHPVTRGWTTIAYRPTTIPTFSRHIDPISITNAKMGFIVTGEANNTYQWEVVRYFEAVSRDNHVIQNVTKSDSDVLGMSYVRDFAASIATSDAGAAVLARFSAYLASTAARGMTHLAMRAQNRLPYYDL